MSEYSENVRFKPHREIKCFVFLLSTLRFKNSEVPLYKFLLKSWKLNSYKFCWILNPVDTRSRIIYLTPPTRLKPIKESWSEANVRTEYYIPLLSMTLTLKMLSSMEMTVTICNYSMSPSVTLSSVYCISHIVSFSSPYLLLWDFSRCFTSPYSQLWVEWLSSTVNLVAR